MRLLPALVVAGALALLAGCAPREQAASVEVAEPLAITSPWARPTPGGVDVSAAYLTLSSRDGDRLVGVAGPEGLASSVEMHEVVTDSTGQMGMQRVEGIDLPAGATVELRPGGHHIMLLGLSHPLVEGDTLSLTLRFERAGERLVRVPVGAR